MIDDMDQKPAPSVPTVGEQMDAAGLSAIERGLVLRMNGWGESQPMNPEQFTVGVKRALHGRI